MMITALNVAQSIGFYSRPFHDKQGNVNPKRIVLKTDVGQADVRLAAFRSMTNVKPISIKMSDRNVIAVFSAESLNKNIAVPKAKR